MKLKKNRQLWTPWDYAMSWGTIGAFTTMNSPVDMIRFRMQVMPILVEQGHLQSLYKGCLNCAKRMYQNEGIRSFFKGNFSNLMRAVPSETLVWSLKQTMQRYIQYRQNWSESSHVALNTGIGIFSSLAVSLTLYPLEYLRQMIQNRTDKGGRSLWHYLKKTISNEGIGGMYKGVGIFTAGLILFRGTFFGIFDTLKVKTRDKKQRWMVSALASFSAISTGYPIDSVRRRFISSRGRYPNTTACFKDIIKKQGIKGLYLGWPMIIIQSISMATISFFYDALITDYDQAIEQEEQP